MNDEEKTAGPSRLGKEAKIGVTVIVVLLLVFAAAMVARLSGAFSGASGDGAALAANHDPVKPGRQDGDRHEKHPPKAAKPKPHGGNPPTLVMAKPDPVKPPKPLDGGLDKWRLAADKGKEKPAAGAGPTLLSPPPLPPEPPKTESGNRFQRHSPDPMAAWNFNDAAQQNKQPADAGFAASDDKPRHRTGREEKRPEHHPDRADADGFASVESPPPPARERNRFENADPLSPAGPPRPDRSHADAAGHPLRAEPVSRYGAAEPSHRPPQPMYEDDAPRRRGPRSFDAPPLPRADGKYEVQPLDSFWTISEKLYGTGAYFKALAEHNRDKVDDEGRLQPGDLVLAPAVEQLEKSYPDLCPKPGRRETLQNRATTVGTRRQYNSGRTYTVAEGDTLFDIARYELGKASRWVEIYELNRDVLGKDFNYITPGTKLFLPDNGRPDVLAEPPSGGYRR